MILERVNQMQIGSIYKSDTGKVYLLKPVNRQYKGRVKKPKYYISELKNNKSCYITGLFATKDKAKFTGDIKDDLGVKQMLYFTFKESGKIIEWENDLCKIV